MMNLYGFIRLSMGTDVTCRLLMNLYLLQHGYIIVILKGDNEKKLQYYKAL